MSEILVSYNVKQPHRKILKEILSGRAEINFLPDIAEKDRTGAIERADVIISWNPAREFSAEELRLAGRVRLIQLITPAPSICPLRCCLPAR